MYLYLHAFDICMFAVFKEDVSHIAHGSELKYTQTAAVTLHRIYVYIHMNLFIYYLIKQSEIIYPSTTDKHNMRKLNLLA